MHIGHAGPHRKVTAANFAKTSKNLATAWSACSWFTEAWWGVAECLTAPAIYGTLSFVTLSIKGQHGTTEPPPKPWVTFYIFLHKTYFGKLFEDCCPGLLPHRSDTVFISAIL